MVICHNHIYDVLCRRDHLSVGVEKSHGLTSGHNCAHPADVLISGWTEESLLH